MISVIIATYNRANLIERAIESILEQTFADYEIIVVDDCSTDNTIDVINKINNKKIKYFCLEENCGAGKARNIGVLKAEGSFITFLDSDDYYYDNSVLEKINIASKNFDVVSFRKYCVETSSTLNIEESPIKGDVYKYLMEHPLHYIGKPPYAIRKDMFLKAGGFSETLRWGDALGLWRNLFKNGAKLNIIEDLGYVVFVHNGNRVSTGDESKSRKERKMVLYNVFLSSFKEHLTYLNSNKVSKAIWLILLLRLCKSMRCFLLFFNLIKQIFNNGIRINLIR